MLSTMDNGETTKTQQVLDLARRLGLLRPRDLEPYQIPAYYPWRMAQRALLERVGRGLYMLPGAVRRSPENCRWR